MVEIFKNKEVIKNEKKIELGIDGTVGVIIFFIVIRYVLAFDVPYLNTDEFGYWGSASFFAGYDWSAVTSPNNYFSYGYGLILAPLLLCIKDSIVCFKVAIILNAFFLFGLYIMLKKILYIVYGKEDVIKCCIISVAATLYCSSITYAGMSLPECLLAFLYSVNVYSLLLFFKNPTWKSSIGILGLSVYMYIVHQRTIVFLIINLIFIVSYLFIKFKEEKNTLIKIVLIILLMGGSFIMTVLVKKVLQSEVWEIQQGSNNIAVGNDFSGQINKLKFLFTQDGVKEFIYSVFGRIFYILVSTYGIFINFIFNVFGIFKNKKESNITKFLYGYIMISVLGAISISCVFLIKPSSTTYLFYGRYCDNIMPLIVALLFFMFDKISDKIFYFSMLGIGMLAILMMYRINSIDLVNHNTSISHVAIHIFYDEKGLNIFQVTLVVILFLSLGYVFVKCLKKNGLVIFMLIYMFSSVHVGYHAVEQFYTKEEIEHIEDIVEISDEIKKLNIKELDVFVWNEEVLGKNDKYGKVIQFINPDIKLRLVTKRENYNTYFVMHNKKNFSEKGIILLKENERYILGKFEK